MTDTKKGSDFTTIVARIAEHAENQGSKTIYTFLDRNQRNTRSFEELNNRAKQIGHSLLKHSKSGDRALMMYPAGLEFIEAFLGCLYAGIVAVPAYPPKKNRNADRIMSIAKNCSPGLLLCTNETRNNVNSMNDQWGNRGLVVATDELSHDSSIGLPRIERDQLAFIQYTSGSTASPKGVLISHRNIVANEKLMQKHWSFSESSLMVSWLPMFHDMGLLAGILAPLFVGFPAVLMAPNTFLKSPIKWLEAMTEYHATVTGAPNFAWDLCSQRITEKEKKKIDLSSLEIASNGGEPVRAKTFHEFSQAFESCGFRKEAFAPSYGMAEATLLISGVQFGKAPDVITASPQDLEKFKIVEQSGGTPIVSCGTVGPGLTSKIVDLNSLRECDEGSIGEIWLHGESIAAGYYKQPDETRRTFKANVVGDRQNWLRTGDYGFLRQGELYITGRCTDMMIFHGRNLYPQDIEQIVENHLDRLGPNSCAAFSIEIEGEEKLVVIAEGSRELLRLIKSKSIFKSDDSEVLIRKVTELKKSIFEKFEVPLHDLVFTKPARFPRTSSGKVQRQLAKKLYTNRSSDLLPGLDNREPAAATETSTASNHLAVSTTRNSKEFDSIILWLEEFAEATHNPLMADEKKHFSAAAMMELGDRGLMGMFVPQEYGGLGLSTLESMQIFEKVAAIDLSLAVFLGIHNGLGVTPIVKHGSNSLKNQLLPKIASGQAIVSFAVSESSSASNPLGSRTTAQQTAHGWELNGQKKWIGMADWANTIVVFAKRIDQSGNGDGTVVLAIPRHAAGVKIGPETLTMGMKGFVQNSVELNSVFVNHDNLLGTPGDGFSVVSEAMMLGRLGVAAESVGVIKRCVQMIHQFATSRTISNGPLIDHPVVRMRVGGMLAAIKHLEPAYQFVSRLVDQSESIPGEVFSALKVCGSTLAGEAADHLVQTLGARGYMEQNLAPKILRDTRVLRIGEGSSEALLSFIGTSVFSSDVVDHFLRTTSKAERNADRLASVKSELRQRKLPLDELAQIQYKLGWLASWLIIDSLSQTSNTQDANWIQQKCSDAETDLNRETVLPTRLEMNEAAISIRKSIGDLNLDTNMFDTFVDPLLSETVDSSVPADSSRDEIQHSSARKSTRIPSPESSGRIQSELSSIVTKHLESVSSSRKPDELDITRNFANLGIDSLEAQSLLADVERRFDIHLGDDTLFEHPTIQSLSAHVATLLYTRDNPEQEEIDVSVVDVNSELFHEARAAVRDALSQMYLGWNDDFDRSYDEAAVFFVARRNGGPITATCRIYIPEMLNGRNPPLSTAEINPLHINSPGDLEGGGLMMTDALSAKHVMRTASNWIQNKGLGSVYMAYDIRNSFIENLYVNNLGLEVIDHPLLSFESFRHRDTRQPVRWRIVVRRGQSDLESNWSLSPANELAFKDLTTLL